MKLVDFDKWVTYYEGIGLSQRLTAFYISIIEKPLSQDFPPIFELHHLSLLLGLERKVLSLAITNPEYFYREFKIPKRRGGLRTISAPYPSLLESQKWIKKEILEKIKISRFAHGYAKKNQ